MPSSSSVLRGTDTAPASRTLTPTIAARLKVLEPTMTPTLAACAPLISATSAEDTSGPSAASAVSSPIETSESPNFAPSRSRRRAKVAAATSVTTSATTKSGIATTTPTRAPQSPAGKDARSRVADGAGVAGCAPQPPLTGRGRDIGAAQTFGEKHTGHAPGVGTAVPTSLPGAPAAGAYGRAAASASPGRERG